MGKKEEIPEKLEKGALNTKTLSVAVLQCCSFVANEGKYFEQRRATFAEISRMEFDKLDYEVRIVN